MAITTENRTVFVCPGQGSQRPNMYQLAERLPEVGATYEVADEIALELFGPSRVAGKSISEWSKEGTQAELATNTVITQPLIIATTIGLIKYLKAREEEATTAYGHSVGELAALYAAGCTSEEDTLKLSMLRGLYSHEADLESSGMMAALLNVPDDVLVKIEFGEKEGVVISTTNNPDQLTISGRKEKVEAIVNDIRTKYQMVKGMTKEEKRQLPNAVLLKIGRGFHSFMMKPAQKAYREALDRAVILAPSNMNYFSNYSHDYEGHPDTIRDHHERQLTHPVDFWKDIGKLIAGGHTRIVEVGPGNILIGGLKEQKTKGRIPDHVQLAAVESEILGIAV